VSDEPLKIDFVLNSRPPAEAARYVLDHMADMVEPIQVIALRHVVERLLAEVATPDGTQERLRAGCPAWGPGSGYVHVSEVEMATLTAERDEARMVLAAARDADDWDPGAMVMLYDSAIDQRDALATQLAQAEQGVEGFDPLENVWVERDCPGEDCRKHRPGQHTHVRKVSGWRRLDGTAELDNEAKP
jgi:hypothetical protein